MQELGDVCCFFVTPAAIECSRTEFECRNGEKCIATSKHCDGIFDCLDFSDEDNCSIGTQLQVHNSIKLLKIFLSTNRKHYRCDEL